MLLGVVILSASLASCGITKKYEAPKVDTEQLYGNQTSADTTTIATIPWREYFTDPILQKLIEEGLANNFDMKTALFNIEEAKENLRQSKISWLPSVGVILGDTHNSLSSKNANGDVKYLSKNTNQYSFGLAATWELNIWGKISSTKRSKLALFLKSQEARNLVQTNIVAGIATYYYTLLSLDEQLKITNESVDLLKETVSTNEALMKAGQVNAASVEQTKATLYSTQLSIPNIEMSIHEMENSLSLLLGRKAGIIERSTFAQQTVPQELKAGVPFQMLANRPDVRSAELTFRSAFELTNAARANFYPTLSISQTIFGVGASNFSNLFKPESLLFNLVGNIVQPIFSQGQLSSGLKIAKLDQEIALNSFKQTVFEAGNEVSNILFTFNTSLTKNAVRDQQVKSLENSVEYTQLLLKAGEANYLEVISAESNLLSARLGKVNDKLEQLQASIDLYKALGGGIQ